MCVEAQYVAESDLRARSWDLSYVCHNEVTGQTQPRTNGECGLYVPDALVTVIQIDVSVVIVTCWESLTVTQPVTILLLGYQQI